MWITEKKRVIDRKGWSGSRKQSLKILLSMSNFGFYSRSIGKTVNASNKTTSLDIKRWLVETWRKDCGSWKWKEQELNDTWDHLGNILKFCFLGKKWWLSRLGCYKQRLWREADILQEVRWTRVVIDWMKCVVVSGEGSGKITPQTLLAELPRWWSTYKNNEHWKNNKLRLDRGEDWVHLYTFPVWIPLIHSKRCKEKIAEYVSIRLRVEIWANHINLGVIWISVIIDENIW